MLVARDRLKQNWTDSPENNDQAVIIFDFLAFSYSHFNLWNKAFEYAEAAMSHITPNHYDYSRIFDNYQYYKNKANKSKQQKHDPGENSFVEVDYFGDISDLIEENDTLRDRRPEMQRYEELCKIAHVHDSIAPKMKNRLKCYYWTQNGRPSLLIQPVKLELINLEPTVGIFRDVISEKIRKSVVKAATSHFQRATIQDPLTGEQRSADYRVSKSAWFEYGRNADMAKITDLVHEISGLDSTHTEHFQMSNYGLGGQYTPHYDSTRPTDARQPSPIDGNRIATALIYLEQPELGGNTVFTEIGLSVPATAGDILFWYNLHPDESLDWDTRHAACPVLAGFKTVANLWLHVRDQEWSRKCVPDREERSKFKIVGSNYPTSDFDF